MISTRLISACFKRTGLKDAIRSFSSAKEVNYDATQYALMAEECIAVDEEDNIVGKVSKADAHRMPNLTLHRAFSVFAFTPENQLILQKRSNEKITFPNLWTNTCCSHPLHNDREMNGANGVKRAAIRKLNHELGIEDVKEADCSVIGRFLYKAAGKDLVWGEHEMDYLLILRNVQPESLKLNYNEVSEVKVVDVMDVSNWVNQNPEQFSPWFLLLTRNGYLRSWWTKMEAGIPIPTTEQIINLS